MDEWASVKAQRDDMESQLLVERSKVDLLKIDLAKTREQAETEKQGLMDVLNDLVTQHDELRQEGEGHRQRLQEREQSLAESRKSLEATRQELVDYQRWLQQSEDSLREHRQSISFRFLIKAGRPVVAVQRLLRSLFSGG